MNFRTTGLLLSLAIGLTLWAILVEARNVPVWEGAGKLFPTLEPSDIVEMRVELRDPDGGKRLFRLEREGEYRWVVREPVDFPAFLPRVQGLTWSLADIVEVDRIQDESDAAKSAIPAGGPEMVIGFRTRQGGDRKIEVGREYEVGDLRYLYIRLDGREVYVTKSELRDSFQLRLDEIRSRALFPIAPPDARSLVVKDAAGDVTLALARSEEGGSWTFDESTALARSLADPAKVNELLVLLNSWGIEEFVTDEAGAAGAKSLADFGLAPPVLRVLGVHSDGSKVELEIGKEVEKEGKKLVYVRRASWPGSVYSAAIEPLPALRRSAETYRTEHVFSFDAARIARVSCRSPKSSYALERRLSPRLAAKEGERKALPGDYDWVIVTGDGTELPGDHRLIHAALGELSSLLIQAFLPALADSARIDDYDTVVEVTLDTGEKRVLRIGPRSEDPQDEDLEVFRAVRSTDTSHFLIETYWPQRVEGGPWVFRERKISRLVPNRLFRFNVETGKRKWSLVRLPGERQGWSLPPDVEIRPGLSFDPSIADDLVSSLSADDLVVQEFDPEVALADRASLGIGTNDFRHAVELDVVDGGTSGFHRLVIGYEVPDSKPRVWWAWSDSPAVAMLLTARVPERLARLIEHLETVTEAP